MSYGRRSRSWSAGALLLLQACAPTPVAVSWPEPPRLPQEVKELATRALLPTPPASVGMTLTEEFSLHWTTFLEELRQSFREATPRSLPSAHASPTTNASGGSSR